MQNMDHIYKEYFQTVYKYLFCLTRDADLAEEMTQETFYQALKTVKNFRGECKISVWLCQIAKYLWFKECKKRNRMVILSLESIEFKLTSEQNVEDELLIKEARKKLYREIESLDEKTKEVMYLRLTGDLSFKEIGDILNRNETWARVTFYRGKRRLFGGKAK